MLLELIKKPNDIKKIEKRLKFKKMQILNRNRSKGKGG